MSSTVAGLLVQTLERIGVTHIFGVIGDSLNPIVDAVRRTKIEWVGVRHEGGAALAAAGQAKLTGRLSVCCGTTGPGSTRLVPSLHEANRDHAPVLALSGEMSRVLRGGDGGFNMPLGEFLTAVHHQLPVNVVVYNNGAFGLITLEAEALGLPAYRKGIEFPNPDYVALARACGGHGFRAAQPGELRGAIEQASRVNGPAIIDCAVVPNEMPNFPRIELDQVGHYAIAKAKEAIDSFVGR